MAAPSNPLLSEIVLEGIKQAGEFNPSSDLVTRATSMWIEQIKNDIWHLAKKPKVLHTTAYTIVHQGQSRYAYPDDYSSDLTLKILVGSALGTSQGGTVSLLILAASDQSTANIIGKEVLMMSGSSVGSLGQIVSYNPTTKEAGLIPELAMTPVAGDTYMIIDREEPVEIKPMYEDERKQKLVSPALPQVAYPMGDDHDGYFVFNCPPDTTYGLRLRYYVDLTQTDVDSDLMSTLYRRWRNIFVQGIKMMKLADENDDREEAAEGKYRQKMQALIYREIYGMDLSNMSDTITDYQ